MPNRAQSWAVAYTKEEPTNVPACVDPRIGGAHPDRVQHPIEQERPHRVAGPDLATDDGCDDVGRARRVVEDGAGVVGERAEPAA